MSFWFEQKRKKKKESVQEMEFFKFFLSMFTI